MKILLWVACLFSTDCFFSFGFEGVLRIFWLGVLHQLHVLQMQLSLSVSGALAEEPWGHQNL